MNVQLNRNDVMQSCQHGAEFPTSCRMDDMRNNDCLKADIGLCRC